MPGLPELLTVEEAARLIRVGRTKAYAMTRQWRATDGRSGLPVVDFGNVLRVPRQALEELIGAPLEDQGPVRGDVGVRRGHIDSSGEPAPPAGLSLRAPVAERSSPTRQRSRRASPRPANQLDLFEPTAPAN